MWKSLRWSSNPRCENQHCQQDKQEAGTMCVLSFCSALCCEAVKSPKCEQNITAEALLAVNFTEVVEQPRCRRPRSYSGRLDQLASTLAMIYRIEHTFFVSDHQRMMSFRAIRRVSDNVHH